MGAIDLLSKLVKFGLTNIARLSSTARLIIIAGLAFLFRLYVLPVPQRIWLMSFSDFFHPLNMSSLDWVKVYPNLILARDKFKNLLQVNCYGVP